MKRFCILVAILLTLCSTALANFWGLRGELYRAVSGDHTWDSYTAYNNQSGETAVMESRYHNALMTMIDGELHVYTTAVWQPDDNMRLPKVTQKDNELTLSYADESYTFRFMDGMYWLEEAASGQMTVTRRGDNYYASTGNEEVLMRQDFPLHTFNIRLFPRTLEEVRHLNTMYAALDSGVNVFGYREEGELGTYIDNAGKGTTPVYSAPFGKSAWRAAKGKAAVSLKDGLCLLGCFSNQDGDVYAAVRYEVSQRTQRIGFIDAKKLPAEHVQHSTPVDELIAARVYATTDTWLTDDPLCSQFAQFDVPAGTQFTCHGTVDDYAYVTAEVRNGEFVGGGEIVWGFVPLRDLAIEEGSRREEIMAQLAGTWFYYAGGSMAEDYVILGADGSFVGTMGHTFSSRGAWYVREYNSAWNLYWNDPVYEMVILRDDGRVTVHGLFIDSEDEFSLTNWEGGGGYQRVEPFEINYDQNTNG